MLTLTLGIVLAWTDYSCISGSSSYLPANSHHECQDVSDHSELSDNHTEDQASGCDYKTNLLIARIGICFAPFENSGIKKIYISSIWQPPKFV